MVHADIAILKCKFCELSTKNLSLLYMATK